MPDKSTPDWRHRIGRVMATVVAIVGFCVAVNSSAQVIIPEIPKLEIPKLQIPKLEIPPIGENDVVSDESLQRSTFENTFRPMFQLGNKDQREQIIEGAILREPDISVTDLALAKSIFLKNLRTFQEK